MHLTTSPSLLSILGVLSNLFISSTSANCLHGTTLYQTSLQKRSKAENSTSTKPPFGYEDRLSALNWANLSPQNYLCATSKTQSPINLSSNISFAQEHAQVAVPMTVNASLINLGTNVEVAFEGQEGGGATILGGETYKLVQFHFHTPSEHRVEREYFPVEIHMVHENIGNSSPHPFPSPSFPRLRDSKMESAFVWPGS